MPEMRFQNNLMNGFEFVVLNSHTTLSCLRYQARRAERIIERKIRFSIKLRRSDVISPRDYEDDK